MVHITQAIGPPAHRFSHPYSTLANLM